MVFEKIFIQWIERICTFNETPLYLNSEKQRISQYQKEYIADLEFINEEDGNEYFDIKTQVKIDEYLNDTLLLLDNHKTEENSESIEEIKHEVENLRASQTRLKKKEIREIVARIWAKCRSLSLALVQEVSKGVIVDLIKGLLLGA